MIRALWPWGARGHWDQGLLTLAFEGKLWPGFAAEEHLESRPEKPGSKPPLPTDRGAIVVCSGGIALSWGVEQIRATLDKLPWCLYLSSSDEGLRFDPRTFAKDGRRIWLQMPRPGRFGQDRGWLLGTQCDTFDLARPIERKPLAARALRWTFGGQRGCARRQGWAGKLQGRTGGDIALTDGFSKGLPRPEYLAHMATAAIAPCPPGPATPDTFRMYEAIMMGCLPICDRFSTLWPQDERGGYWRHVLGFEPFPCIDHWDELPALMDRYEADPVALQRDANKAGAWWMAYQRKIVTDMIDDVERLSGEQQPRHAVTVLMPTSPIPAHPSTAGIEEAIRRTRSYPELRDAEIIIMIDGVRPEQAHRAADYEEYKRRLIELCQHHPDFKGCLPLVFDEWTHQAGMARRALELVRTPLVLYVEHDTYPVGDIDWSGIFRACERPDVNAVKLSIFHRVLDEHAYLMLDLVPQDIGGVPLIRTMQWSQRPHVAKTSWYKRTLAECFGRESRTFIEDVLWAVIFNQMNARQVPHEHWGLWLYAPSGDMTRSATSNGRAADPKYPMIVAYDGERPQGAPRPGVLG